MGVRQGCGLGSPCSPVSLPYGPLTLKGAGGSLQGLLGAKAPSAQSKADSWKSWLGDTPGTLTVPRRVRRERDHEACPRQGLKED